MIDKTVIFKRIADGFLMELASEFIAQGHNNTGAALKSLRYEIQGEKIVFFGNDYLLPVNTGVAASRIPYSGRSGRGGKSKYIRGLAAFALSRGIASSEKEALNVAFAIANKQKKEGMPTRSSFRFSQNGRRTDFIGQTAKNLDKVILNAITPEIIKGLNETFRNGTKSAKATA